LKYVHMKKQLKKRRRFQNGLARACRLYMGAGCISLLIIMLGCASSGETPLPDETSLTISATPLSITNFGDTAQLTTQAILADGHVVVDGTRITLTLVSGDGFLRTASEQGTTITLTTVNGETKATYVSGETIEPATITARTGSIGGDGSIAVTVDVTEKFGDPQLLLSPNNLFRTGGRTVLTLLVSGPDGKPLPGETVTFSTDRGALASNGTPVKTDAGGAARDTLFLNQPSDDVLDVNVTAAVGNKTSQGAISISTNENPVPVIVVSPSTVIKEETVFLDASNSTDDDGDIVYYQWWFGDGQNATGITTNHNYEEDGVYTVLLQVTDDAGATMGVTEDIYVGDYTAPTAAFTTSPSAPRVNVPMFFNAESSSDADGSIEAYDWDFGDGTTSDEGPLTTHTYLAPETYTVTLKVTDNDGVTATTSTTVVVVGNTDPTASFTADPNPASLDQEIAFDATASTDGTDGEIVSYHWNFGDGETSNVGPLVRHQYATPGIFEVFLTVTDNEGGQGFFLLAVTVNDNAAPSASFTTSNAKPAILERVGFDATGSTDTDGEIVSYRWDFGDGYQVYTTSPLARHGYTKSGEYTVFLEVTDDTGLKGFSSSTLSVQANVAPTASFTPSNVKPDIDEPVVFDGTASADTEGPIVSYLWDFGDGHISTRGPVVTHSYTKEGIFAVLLTVTDENGAKGVTGSTITVASTNVAPTADFTYTPTAPTTDQVVTLDATLSTDTDGEIVEYIWEFGSPIPLTEYDPIVRIKFPDPGSYLIFLTVVDNEGAVGYLTKELIITAGTNIAPTAAFTFAPDPPVIDQNVVFDGSTSTDSDGTIVKYTWLFGDGSTGNSQTVSHVYTAAGTYTAELLVEDDQGAIGSTSSTVTVSLTNAPIPAFQVLQGEGNKLILDATESKDPQDPLDKLQFTFQGFNPNGTMIPMPRSTGPLQEVTIKDNWGSLSFVLMLENSAGITARQVRNVQLPHLQTNPHQPKLHANPMRIPAPGGRISLEAWNLTSPHKTAITVNVMGSAKVQQTQNGPNTHAIIHSGQPGDRVVFRLLAPGPNGQFETVTRIIELTANETLAGPKALLTSTIKPDNHMDIDLTALVQTDVTYEFKGFSSRPGVNIAISPNPHQPHKAKATVVGAVPGDYLIFHLRVIGKGGLADVTTQGLRIPKHGAHPSKEGGL